MRQTNTLAGTATPPTTAGDSKPFRPLKVVCIGAHPDDPETCCAGTLAKYVAAGHSVTVVYLTRGEAGIKHKTHDEAAAIRTKEAEAACEMLKVKPVFFGEIDGAGSWDNASLKKMQDLLAEEKPDIVFTHWILDTHKDHAVTGLLTFIAWTRAKEKFDLYYFEPMTGEQALMFMPTDYVDISDVLELKHKSAYCHASQKLASVYVGRHPIHTMMEQYRGATIRVPAAEAFIRQTGLHQGNAIPGLS